MTAWPRSRPRAAVTPKASPGATDRIRRSSAPSVLRPIDRVVVDAPFTAPLQGMTEKAKVRSAEEEEALDRRIAEIRRKNEALERRQKEVEEDRARAQPQRKHSAATEHASAVLGDEKKSQHQKKESVKRSNEKGIKEWSREWDHGKTSAETWIVNVPEMDHETKSSFNRTANQRGGRGGHRGGRGGPANIANAGSRRSTGGESSKSHRSQHDDRSTPPKKEERGGLAGRLTRTDANGKKESVTVAQIQDKNHNNPKRPNLNTRGGHEFSARGRGAPRTRGGAQGRPEAAKEPRAKNVSNFPKPNVNHNKNRQHFNKNNNRGGPRNNNSDAKVIRLLVDDLVTKACQLALSEELQS